MIDHAANERAERDTADALRRAEELLEDGNSVKDTMDLLDDEFLGSEIWPSASAALWREVENLARRGTVEWVPTAHDPGLSCPQCGAWPFSDEQALAGHDALWHAGVSA